MYNETKVKAGRNHTLTLAADEVAELERTLSSAENIASGGIVDTIVNADMRVALEMIPDRAANLIIIDPPYNLTKNFNGSRFAAMDAASYEEYVRSWFSVVCDKLADDGTLYMCGDWKCTSSLQRVIEERLTVLNRITWQREKGRGARANWKNGMEDIWFAVRDPKNYYFDVEAVKMKRRVLAPYRESGRPKDWTSTENGNFRLTHPSNFWDDISVPFWSMPENTDHPTQKPEKLYAKLILASSKPGDLVLDPFMGSGTSAVVAKKLGRHYCGIEINREYCLWAAKRLKMAESSPDIQGYANGVFWERNSLASMKRASE